MLIFDIGANVGKYAQAQLSLHPEARVVCVEATPSTYEKLCSNYKTDSRVTCLNYAVCNSSMPNVELYISREPLLNTLNPWWLNDPSSRFGSVKHSDIINVPATSVDALITTYGTPDILKIDVEGAEDKVLNSLSTKTPVLLFEWAAEGRTTIYACLDRLTSLGYSRYHIQHLDVFTYNPTQYSMDVDEVRAYIKRSVDKQDWGMIWAV